MVMPSLENVVSRTLLMWIHRYQLVNSAPYLKPITAVVIDNLGQRFELGTYLLVDLIPMRQRLWNNAKLIVGCKALPRRVPGTNISLELNGQKIGYLREDGVFVYTQASGPKELLAWMQATDNAMRGRSPKARNYQNRWYWLSSQELVVLAFGATAASKKLRETRLQTERTERRARPAA